MASNLTRFLLNGSRSYLTVQSHFVRGLAAKNQSGGYGGSGPDAENSSSPGNKKNNPQRSGGYAGSSSSDYTSGTYSGKTNESGTPHVKQSGGYVDRDEKTTDKTKDRKTPPSS